MISRLIRVQLVVFVLVSVLGVGAMLLVYVRLPEVLGVGVHHLTVDFAKNAGLYSNAKVLYRGVEIGQVNAVRATPAGAEVDLVVQDDTPLPTEDESPIRVCMQQTGKTRLQCWESIRRSNGRAVP